VTDGFNHHDSLDGMKDLFSKPCDWHNDPLLCQSSMASIHPTHHPESKASVPEKSSTSNYYMPRYTHGRCHNSQTTITAKRLCKCILKQQPVQMNPMNVEYGNSTMAFTSFNIYHCAFLAPTSW
jgi:hypothetical protein